MDPMFMKSNKITFFINDVGHSVKTEDIPPETTLNTYLRTTAHLMGTKIMCREGVCGACIVAVSYFDPVTKCHTIISINSCLVLLYSCAGWKIYTSDGIGDPKSGYHPVQKALVQFNGTQCGFCSSGMVMNMYALYESKNDFTMKDAENSFSGNTCRCTGYRPILSAFKSLASDAKTESSEIQCDIEDIPVCKKSEKCNKQCPGKVEPHFYTNKNFKWYKPYSINDVLDLIKINPNQEYMLVGGNTATGVYPRTEAIDLYIDITNVGDLLGHTVNDKELILGANMTLSNVKILFEKISEENSNFCYLKKLADHIELVANRPVQNVGTIAGNLMIKYKHNEFPSDIFVILEAVGATLTLVDTERREFTTTLEKFLTLNMSNTIIKQVILPSLDKTFRYESYKIMQRAENAGAIVNAGFLIQMDKNGLVKSARIVYGGISPNFTHASSSENYLTEKNLFDNSVLQGLFKTLDGEMHPTFVLPDPSPKFRKDLAIALFYKFVLSIAPEDKITSMHRSGGLKQTRPVSSGTQSYGTTPDLYPLTQPISKIEALPQCTGKAEYVIDILEKPNQLYAVLVLAKAPANSVITKIDASAALKLDGVKGFYDKSDIPGRNTFTPIETSYRFIVNEELFCNGVVRFYFQPIGVVVATSQKLAEKAANLVQVSYIPGQEKPLLTIRDVIANNAAQKIFKQVSFEAETKGDDVKHVVQGKFDIFWQYHYHMETHSCVVTPNEDGFDVESSTQNMNVVQIAIAKMLDIPVNRINVSVRRLGGSFGAKMNKPAILTTSCALAAHKLQKSVKMTMSMETNMNVIGKRLPFSGDYEVGLDDNGIIQYLNSTGYTDFGNDGGNENLTPALLKSFLGVYKSEAWNLNVYSVKTDTPTCSSARGPARVESLGFLEALMEHIAMSLNLDPISFRLKNVGKPEVAWFINDLVEWAEVRPRQKQIEKFNQENRWVKKGLAVVPLCYPVGNLGHWHSHVSIFQGDGTVAVTHGGIEMGQGINTKAAQVCAYALKIPLKMVTIKPCNNIVSPNNAETSASIASESVSYATLKACEILNERMKPIRDTMQEPVDWRELVQRCFIADIDLHASFLYHKDMPGLNMQYSVFGATCAEVEVDILTGTQQLTRVDLIQDVGDSTSPNIDVGQVEGGFVQGVGYWTSEKIIFNDEGKLLTNRARNYLPPSSKDIPIDFRIKFPKNIPNTTGILNSKATGETTVCSAIAVPLAIRHAVASARLDSDPKAEKWYPIDGPSTVENTFLSSLNDYTHYTL